MPTKDERPLFAMGEWNGTEPYKAAEFAAYPISEQERCELNAIYNSYNENVGDGLPKEIWPQFDAASSMHVETIEERQYDQPPWQTRKHLASFEQRLLETA